MERTQTQSFLQEDYLITPSSLDFLLLLFSLLPESVQGTKRSNAPREKETRGGSRHRAHAVCTVTGFLWNLTSKWGAAICKARMDQMLTIVLTSYPLSFQAWQGGDVSITVLTTLLLWYLSDRAWYLQTWGLWRSWVFYKSKSPSRYTYSLYDLFNQILRNRFSHSIHWPFFRGYCELGCPSKVPMLEP